jgi:eukaryotic-like serine/threonine-protein kinase
MGPERWITVESLYHGALDRDPTERTAWLHQACGDEAALIAEVESLLACCDASLSNPAARPELSELFNRIAQGSGTVPGDPVRLATKVTPPSFIGPYRILRLLGEGGMGVVYEAEQQQPRRIVALKVIRSGLGDPKLIRRFEQESLVLGRLQHPGIAQIYEAGTAEDGSGSQPYFAMEFVRGEPLLQYAEARHLSSRDKLQLMEKICDAVQHAHLRGIIHRDLKPANILVDESGQPKILDFGVARAIDSDAHVTRQTDLGQLVGTLAYMSPEQVLGDPLELDARSDVYALGVTLYQLLAGRLPYRVSPKLHEAVQTIREGEPAPLGAASPEFRGDIETIVAKALEKDRARRYASAAELASDIGRYLQDEPIMARPASTIYQLQKFARRHRALVWGVAAVFAVLVAGTAVSTREAVRANAEAATSRAISDFLRNDLLAQTSAANQGGPNNKPDANLKVRTALDRAAAGIKGKFDRQPAVEAAIRDTIGQTYMDLGLNREARTQLDRALELRRRVLGEKNPETLKTMNRVGYTAYLQGKYGEAEELLGRTLGMQRRALGGESPDTASSMNDLATVYWAEGKYPRAESLQSQTLEIRRRVLGANHPDTLGSMNNLAIVYKEEAKYPKAEALQRQVLEIRRRVSGPEHPDTLKSMNNLAVVYFEEGKYAETEALVLQTLEIRRRLLGAEHPMTLTTLHNLANIYYLEGKFGQAEALYNQTLDARRRTLGPEHPDTLTAMNDLANVYLAQGKYELAEVLYSKTLDIQRRVLGPKHRYTMAGMTNVAGAYAAEGKYAQAEALFLRSLDSMRSVLGPAHPAYLGTASMMGSMYQRQGKYALAETCVTQALEGRRRTLGPGHPETAASESDLALALQSQGKFAEAEPLAHEALEFNRKKQPDNWQRFRAESLLGASLAGQKKYAEAEPLLIEGYEGMMARKERIEVPDWYQLDRAAEWIIQLYQSWGKSEKADEWRKKLTPAQTAH